MSAESTTPVTVRADRPATAHRAASGRKEGHVSMNRRHTRAVLSLLAIVCLALSVAAAGLSSTKKKTITITVAGLLPGTSKDAHAQLNERIAAFQKLNPGIKVKAPDYQWLPASFATALAGHTLPDVFTVPFTDD